MKPRIGDFDCPEFKMQISSLRMMNSVELLMHVKSVIIMDHGDESDIELKFLTPRNEPATWKCRVDTSDVDEYVNHVRRFSPNVKVSNEIDITPEMIARMQFIKWLRREDIERQVKGGNIAAS